MPRCSSIFAALMEAFRANRGFSVLVAVLLLLTTAAPALVRMSCLSGGHSVLSIGQADDCCPQEDHHGDGPQLRARCCEMERTAPVHAAFTMENGHSTLAVVTPAPAVHIDLVPRSAILVPGYAFVPRPPPLLAAQRLSRVGSFLI